MLPTATSVVEPEVKKPAVRPSIRLPWRLTVEGLVITGLVLVRLLAHGLNMFGYPARSLLEDEGIYISQAWAVLKEQRLSPYSYTYDHAPGGWLLTALWMRLSGGLHSFGDSSNSGRVFMLVLHLLMVVLLYRLARRLECGLVASALAVLLFSISPLALFFQRLLLLDNIMLAGVLLSLNWLFDQRERLSRIIWSGLIFGLAILSKETAVFLIPAMLLIVWHHQRQRRHHGRFALVAWLLPMLMVVSWYPLYAALKGELLPAGLSLNLFLFKIETPVNRASLLQTVIWQAQRDGGGFLNPDNLFWQTLRNDWLRRDPLLVTAASLAIVVNLVRGRRYQVALLVGLLGLLPMLYLGRGGIVFNYYILFALPFLCLNLALLLTWGLSYLPRRLSPVAGLALAGLLVVFHWQALQPFYTTNPSRASHQALEWIRQNLNADSLIVTHDTLWTDLRDPPPGVTAFPNLLSHWKVGLDPAVRTWLLNDDPRKIDYLLTTPDLELRFRQTNNTMALRALEMAQLIHSWEVDGTVINLWQVKKALL